jgi:hypothetical protein
LLLGRVSRLMPRVKPTGRPIEPDETSCGAFASDAVDEPQPSAARPYADSDCEISPESLRPTVSVIPPPPDAQRAEAGSGPASVRHASKLTRALAVTLACGALAGGTTPTARALVSDVFGHLSTLRTKLARTAAAASVTPSSWIPSAVAARADAKLVRSGRTPVSPGVLAIPSSFASADGAYDLVVHFHGNTELVIDNVGAAGVNAAVLVINLGINSGVYEDRYASPDELRELLSRTQRAMEKRGLANARLRRLALSSWSAGYGAILRSIENPALGAQVDSVVLLDGMHARMLPEGEPNSGNIDALRIEPFVRFARAAVAGSKLMVITHSDVKPPDYAGVRETTDALLHAVGVQRKPGGTAPEMPLLSSTHGVPKSKIIPLEPRSEVQARGLVVRGYSGELPEHHMAHLIRMATVGLPELARRFGAPTD